MKNIMVDNIEKVLERGEKIELLVDKTDNLRFQVEQGRRAGSVRRAGCGHVGAAARVRQRGCGNACIRTLRAELVVAQP